ncbi:hypothetical protein ACSBL2_00405 [Pedobacter sp. AW31-3R]|uniref:hypothetical protein n=1 Tax=Pedobacter sp. AW31-3R TaxID=3445781 RepID=UPI003FA18437
MEKPATKISADLQKFIDKFEPSKFKLMAKGIEVRGISDLNKTIAEAKQLIEKMKLKLTVVHHAEMVSCRAFEVNVIPAA